jgi:hypothetical protein
MFDKFNCVKREKIDKKIILQYMTIYIAMMGRSRTFRKNTKSHRKKSNVRKSRSFRKKRNAMRGGFI